MSGANCHFLTCIQASQEVGYVVCYFLFSLRIFQFVVIHTVKDFSLVNEAKVGVFLEFSEILMLIILTLLFVLVIVW